jgi:hypothetical protein
VFMGYNLLFFMHAVKSVKDVSCQENTRRISAFCLVTDSGQISTGRVKLIVCILCV